MMPALAKAQITVKADTLAHKLLQGEIPEINLGSHDAQDGNCTSLTCPTQYRAMAARRFLRKIKWVSQNHCL